MGRKHLSGNTISMNNEVNLKGPGVRTWSTKRNSWPPLTVPTPDISSSFAGMLPSLMGAMPVSSGKAGAGSSLAMAALGSVCASVGISLASDPAGSGFLASYTNVLQRVMSGAYAQAGTLDEEKLKKQVMALIAQMLEKAGPGFASWKQVLMAAMQNATLQDFMKGVQSAVCAMTGDPVNANTGNFVYEKDDLLVKGRIPLCFKRSYNCIDTRTGCMGEGWRHNYEIQLLIENNRYIILWEDGREELYLRDEDNTPEPLFGGFCRLRREGKGFLYETQDRKVYTFDGKGCLLKQEDLNGQGLSFMYDKQDRLSSVTNRCGSSLNYKYDSFSGMLMQVTDHTGRSVNLSYELGCLKEVKNAAGASYFYSYDADKNIFRISNPRGIYVLENSYDDQSRTIRQAFADSGEITYDYQKDLSRTLVTEQNGNKVVYVHDEKFRNVRTVYLDGEETFRYNDRNQLVTKKDKNGNITKISYDDKGNISQIIYPDGAKHNMTYDENNHLLILSVNGITKLKNTYDAKGNLIRTVDALGRCRAIEYDEPGNPVKLKEPDGSIISYTYDSCGNMNRITDGAGNCTVYEYDECNRVIRTLDGNGNRTNFSYDENNQITCVTNAAGKNRIYE